MKQNSNNKLKVILGITLILIIIICAIYVQFSNSKHNENNDIYSNINIDKSKLNIFFFNVGQADSSLILYEDKVILIDKNKIIKIYSRKKAVPLQAEWEKLSKNILIHFMIYVNFF